MVEFWNDHFNVSQLKAEDSWLKTVDDRLVRQHALGKFRDLLSASAHRPAMLFYLDNDKNRKRDPATGAGPNENYARELLELHTLGIGGGYSLKDIQEILGVANDASVARTLVPLVTRPEDNMGVRAAGLIAGWTASEAATARRRFMASWDNFRDTKRFWKR